MFTLHLFLLSAYGRPIMLLERYTPLFSDMVYKSGWQKGNGTTIIIGGRVKLLYKLGNVLSK